VSTGHLLVDGANLIDAVTGEVRPVDTTIPGAIQALSVSGDLVVVVSADPISDTQALAYGEVLNPTSNQTVRFLGDCTHADARAVALSGSRAVVTGCYDPPAIVDLVDGAALPIALPPHFFFDTEGLAVEDGAVFLSSRCPDVDADSVEHDLCHLSAAGEFTAIASNVLPGTFSPTSSLNPDNRYLLAATADDYVVDPHSGGLLLVHRSTATVTPILVEKSLVSVSVVGRHVFYVAADSAGDTRAGGYDLDSGVDQELSLLRPLSLVGID
jgi:hypothetical protein